MLFFLYDIENCYVGMIQHNIHYGNTTQITPLEIIKIKMVF